MSENQEVKANVNPVRFVSEFSGLTLAGNSLPGITQPGLVSISPYGAKTITPGKQIRFENGEYVTKNPDEIEAIRAHKWYGQYISEPDDPDGYQKRLKAKNVKLRKGE